MTMKYKVVVSKSARGYKAHCPAFRAAGHGDTEQQALDNIRVQIADYLRAVSDFTARETLHEIEVPL